MAFHGNPVTKEKWLENIHELVAEKEIYMRFVFPHGQLLSKLSKLQVDGKMIQSLQQQSILEDYFPTELWLPLPEEPEGFYQIRTNTKGGICLALFLRQLIGERIALFFEIYLSNQENFLDREGSESLLR
jgi:hypothetical protein